MRYYREPVYAGDGRVDENGKESESDSEGEGHGWEIAVREMDRGVRLGRQDPSLVALGVRK